MAALIRGRRRRRRRRTLRGIVPCWFFRCNDYHKPRVIGGLLPCCCWALLLQLLIIPWSKTTVAAADADADADSLSGARIGKVGTFLWLSDLHLDPFYGTPDAAGRVGADCFQANHHPAPPEGQWGCDSPYALLNATLQQIQRSTTTTTTTMDDENFFVIVTGDFCRHATDRLDRPIQTTQAILRNVSALLVETLGGSVDGGVSIIPSLGNNDVTPDYYLDVHDPTELLTMAADGFDSLWESETERTTFLRGGYFARNVSTANLTVLSLNTLLYSTSHIPEYVPDKNDDEDDDPLGQFAWLEVQLDLACSQDRNRDRRRIYLIGHIPPAMGSYRHSQLWHEQYSQRYYSILQTYSTCIAGQFFGHLHADEFRSINIIVPPTVDETTEAAPNTTTMTTTMGPEDDPLTVNEATAATEQHWPLWLASSVTPIYGSNPSYRWVSYEQSTGELLDYDTYYLNLLDHGNQKRTTTTINNNNNNNGDAAAATVLEWKKGPSFCDSFDLPDLSSQSVQSLVQRLNRSSQDPDDEESSLWQTLVDRQHVFDKKDPTSCTDVSCRRAWICTLTTITSLDYADCLAAAGANTAEVALARLSPKERVILGVVVMAAAMVVLCLFVPLYLGQRYLRRRHYQQHTSTFDDEEDAEEQDAQDEPEVGAAKTNKYRLSKTTSSSTSSSTATSTTATRSFSGSYHHQEVPSTNQDDDPDHRNLPPIS